MVLCLVSTNSRKYIAILTCKSIHRTGFEEGKRLIESSSNWFSPKFPLGKLALVAFEFHPVNLNVTGIGVETIYSQSSMGEIFNLLELARGDNRKLEGHYENRRL